MHIFSLSTDAAALHYLRCLPMNLAYSLVRAISCISMASTTIRRHDPDGISTNWIVRHERSSHKFMRRDYFHDSVFSRYPIHAPPMMPFVTVSGCQDQEDASLIVQRS
jgi:hypothetical protein